jgi:hypothetical protein
MVSVKVSKNASCQALPSFRLLLKKAQHFARTGIFFFGSCSSFGSQICSSSGSVDIDMLRLPAGLNTRRSKRSGGELEVCFCVLLKQRLCITISSGILTMEMDMYALI